MTPNEKSVYFALLNKCNELAWKNPFNQSNGYLALDSGLNERAMIKARNTLKQIGLIEFKSGDGRRNNTEYLIKDTEKGVKKSTLSDTLSDTLSCQKVSDNTKLINKTKLNERGNARDGTFEFVENLKNRLKNTSWLEQVGMKLGLKPDIVPKQLDDFASEIQLKGDVSKTEKDFKSHFINWLKIQIDKEKIKTDEKPKKIIVV